jgi:hypothetical protein
MQARSVRNHITMWCGYLDLVKVQEECGIRMDGNYFSGHFCREREAAPYSPFGGAMPMRFCDPAGGLFNVYQQHTQISDDIMLAPRLYSYRYSDAMFEAYVERLLDDANDRFHMPVTVNFHPGNWVHFSGPGGISLLNLAREREIPVWSFDQWLTFWETRAAIVGEEWSWNRGELLYRLHLPEEPAKPQLAFSIAIPWRFGGATIRRITLNEEEVPVERVRRSRQEMVLLPLHCLRGSNTVKVAYWKE